MDGISPPPAPDPEAYGLTPRRAQHFQKKPEGFWFLYLLVIPTALFILGNLGLVSKDVGPFPFYLTFLLAIGFTGWLNKYISRFQGWFRTQYTDYPQYLRYQTAFDQHARVVADIKERERLRIQECERHQLLLEQTWKEFDGWTFERKLSELLADHGWNVRLTKGSRDEGVDIVLKAAGQTVIVQCKAHVSLIHPGPVRELYGTLMHQQADEAWLVTTSGFSKGARTFAEGKDIRLLTIREILRTPNIVSP